MNGVVHIDISVDSHAVGRIGKHPTLHTLDLSHVSSVDNSRVFQRFSLPRRKE